MRAVLIGAAPAPAPAALMGMDVVTPPTAARMELLPPPVPVVSLLRGGRQSVVIRFSSQCYRCMLAVVRDGNSSQARQVAGNRASRMCRRAEPLPQQRAQAGTLVTLLTVVCMSCPPNARRMAGPLQAEAFITTLYEGFSHLVVAPATSKPPSPSLPTKAAPRAVLLLGDMHMVVGCRTRCGGQGRRRALLPWQPLRGVLLVVRWRGGSGLGSRTLSPGQRHRWRGSSRGCRLMWHCPRGFVVLLALRARRL